MGETRTTYTIYVRADTGKNSFGKPRRRWENKIKIGINERWMVSSAKLLEVMESTTAVNNFSN